MTPWAQPKHHGSCRNTSECKLCSPAAMDHMNHSTMPVDHTHHHHHTMAPPTTDGHNHGGGESGGSDGGHAGHAGHGGMVRDRGHHCHMPLISNLIKSTCDASMLVESSRIQCGANGLMLCSVLPRWWPSTLATTMWSCCSPACSSTHLEVSVTLCFSTFRVSLHFWI